MYRSNMAKLRAIALYLPQFHPIPENNEWWGEGFTEWTNTAKAKPLYRGHYQPHIPADLGFYDLRLSEVRQAQTQMARSAGIEAFCYYHYWFAGRRILERPFQEVLLSGQPNFPFCLCWANETWTGIWHGAPDRVLIEQTYPGEDDHRAHFKALLPAFLDPRYVCVDGKPIFLIYKPEKLPDISAVSRLWKGLAVRAGLAGLHIVGMSATADWNPRQHGCDAVASLPLIKGPAWVSRRQPIRWLREWSRKALGQPIFHNVEDIYRHQIETLRRIIGTADFCTYPCVVHAWDNTPRSGGNGVILFNTTPETFGRHLIELKTLLMSEKNEGSIIFLKSWNEWAEGNHLEPDLRYGDRWLETLRTSLLYN